MKVYVVKEYAYYGSENYECYVRVYSTEEKAKENLTEIFNDFILDCDTLEEEKKITEFWKKNGTVCDEEGNVWAYMSEYEIDSGVSF